MTPDRGRSRSGGTRRGSRDTAGEQPGPSVPDEGPARVVRAPWTVRPASEQARKEWDAARDAEPVLMGQERERLRLSPLDRSGNPRRTGPLHAGLGTRLVGGVRLPQWQHELTAGGRIWYCPDRKNRVIWVTKVSLTHPRQTD